MPNLIRGFCMPIGVFSSSTGEHPGSRQRRTILICFALSLYGARKRSPSHWLHFGMSGLPSRPGDYTSFGSRSGNPQLLYFPASSPPCRPDSSTSLGCYTRVHTYHRIMCTDDNNIYLAHLAQCILIRTLHSLTQEIWILKLQMRRRSKKWHLASRW